ncbi:MAG: hypothetical protein WCC84_13635 [Candidatus Cybelea sp.]
MLSLLSIRGELLGRSSLADQTRDLAKETRDAVIGAKNESEQRERHHKETLSPNLEVSEVGAVASCQQNQQRELVYSITLAGNLYNIGPGPIRGYKAWLAPRGLPTAFMTYPSLGAGERRNFTVYSKFDAAARQSVNLTLTPGDQKAYPFRCGITYATLFGELGFLVLESDSGTSEDARIIQSAAPQTILNAEAVAAQYDLAPEFPDGDRSTDFLPEW